MSELRKRIAVTLAAVGMLVVAVATSASAAITTGTTRTTLNINPVSCSSSSAWLILRSSLGDKCYTGNGSLTVDLPSVSAEQIIGVHEVCLYVSPATVRCATGPAALILHPPARVIQVSISSPAR
jgi:type 1 fimbria pilin